MEEQICNGQTAKSVLAAICKECDATISVVGYHGRKGPKEDPTVMGTAVQYLSIQTPSPVMIIKNPIMRKERPNGFTMGCLSDGSKYSLNALNLMC